MQEGLSLLWFICVVASLAAWFYLEISLSVAGKFQSRRQITGCELARQVLDQSRLSQTAILPAQGLWDIHFGFDFERLFLSEKAYYGTQLGDLGISLHESAHLLRESKEVVPVDLRTHTVNFLRIAILASWSFIVAGRFFPAWTWMMPFGQFLFVILCIRAFALLGEEWEVTTLGLASLPLLEGLETNELVRVRKLLQAIRWSPLAELFAEPFSLLFRHKRKIPAGAS